MSEKIEHCKECGTIYGEPCLCRQDMGGQVKRGVSENNLTYTRAEMIEHAKKFMRDSYGSPNESGNKDIWHERLGFLLDFITEVIPDSR